MPGRVSTRTSAAPQNLRKSTAIRTAVIPEEGPTSSLRLQICGVFGDAQRTTAGHRKLVVGLRKIQESCVYESSGAGERGVEEFGEVDFNVEIVRCVIRLMEVKKSEAVGDRLVRFIGLFLHHASEKGKRLSKLSSGIPLY